MFCAREILQVLIYIQQNDKSTQEWHNNVHNTKDELLNHGLQRALEASYMQHLHEFHKMNKIYSNHFINP